MLFIELTDGSPFRTLAINPTEIAMINGIKDFPTEVVLKCGVKFSVLEKPTEIRQKIRECFDHSSVLRVKG